MLRLLTGLALAVGLACFFVGPPEKEYVPMGREQIVQMPDGTEIAVDELDTSSVDSVEDLYSIYFAIGDYEAALNVLKSELEKNPKYTRALYAIGMLYAEYLGDDEEAVRYLNMAYESDTNDSSAMVGKAEASFILGNTQEGCDLLRAFLSECDFSDESEIFDGYYALQRLSDEAYANDWGDELEWCAEMAPNLPIQDGDMDEESYLCVLQNVILYQYSAGEQDDMLRYLTIYKDLFERCDDEEGMREYMANMYEEARYGFCQQLLQTFIPE